MKKCAFILITVCFLLISAFVAYADLVAKPNNDFFNQYSNECVYLGRSFYVNGADGFVQVRNEPGSNRGGPKIKNGEIVYMEYSCLYRGEFWGLVSSYQNKQAESQKLFGWIKIDGQLLVMYDYVAFEEDYFEDFYTYKGNYAEIKNTRAAVAWPWPGADAPLWTIEDLNTTNFRVFHAYRDEKGREWGFVTYLYDSPNIWICLSDPLNCDIPAFHPAPKPMVWRSETAHHDIGKSSNPTLVLIIVLIVALVIGTIILIKIFWKPKINYGGEHNV
jgi:hypothetical protein